MLIEQVLVIGDLRKAENETLNLKFRTELQAPVESFHCHVLLYGAALLNIFTLTIFCLMLIKQRIDLKKVRTENLKFRTDLQDWVANGWSMEQ